MLYSPEGSLFNKVKSLSRVFWGNKIPSKNILENFYFSEIFWRYHIDIIYLFIINIETFVNLTKMTWSISRYRDIRIKID